MSKRRLDVQAARSRGRDLKDRAVTGGRRLVRERRSIWRLAVPVIALPVAALVVLAIGWVVGPASEPPTGPREVPVTSSTAACPVAGGLVAAVGQTEAGSSTDLVTTTGEDVADSQVDADQWTASAASGDNATVSHQGAGGVEFVAGAHQSTGGLAVAACPRVVDDTWYLGAGTSSRHSSQLVLTNVADVVASVDIELWGPAGPIDAVDENDVVIEPGATTTVQISDLAVGSEEVAIHVVRNRGAVTSALVDHSSSVLGGTEILTSSGEPATETVLSGVTGASTRTLLVANPGSSSASVTVNQTGAEGTFVPEGLDDLAVAAGSVVAVPLPAGSGTDTTAFRVTSDQPVLSSVRINASDKDFAYATGGPAWTGQAVVPVATGGGAIRPVLLMLADDEDATATVTAYDAAMQPVGETTLDVTADIQTSLDLADPEIFGSPDVAYVVVESAEPVHATAVYRQDTLVSLLRLSSVPTTALGPHVQPGF